LSSPKNNLIFISIAAYRDPQLVPTLVDCMKKASNPDRLRFGVCWQRDTDDPPLTLRNDPRLRILDVNWRDSKGACWARAEIMKLWQDEDWFLQVDSHCRFIDGWDTVLLRTMTETGSAKPILSTYATAFTPGENEVLRDGPLQIVFQGFTPDGIPQLRPGAFPPHIKSNQPTHAPPVRARFVSAGFLFAQGHFVEEIPYDPELYFMGEESALTVRAFTHGYDFFHPAQTIIWHDYIRADAKKHWGDHTDTNRVASHWSQLDVKSKRKVQRLLLGEPIERFGLGPVRTLQEYEAYAGLSFRLRKAQQYTVRGEEPPNKDAAPNWTDNIYPWIARIRVRRDKLPEGSLDDPALWSAAIQDNQGYELWRKDFTLDELAPLRSSEDEFLLIAEFSSESIPSDWTIWPMSRSRGWLRKIGGRLPDEDFAVLKEDDDDTADEP
jgi:Glycosyltransferase (GlcNAc)